MCPTSGQSSSATARRLFDLGAAHAIDRAVLTHKACDEYDCEDQHDGADKRRYEKRHQQPPAVGISSRSASIIRRMRTDVCARPIARAIAV